MIYIDDDINNINDIINKRNNFIINNDSIIGYYEFDNMYSLYFVGTKKNKTNKQNKNKTK
jgi:hypothetical protein